MECFKLFCILLDVPGPVGQPFNGENLTTDSCKLTWFTPEDDGGSAITNYIIEKREADRRGYTSVSYTVTRNNAVVQGLVDGKGYFFRIAAENIIGRGPFVDTPSQVMVKDPICKSWLFFIDVCMNNILDLKSS